jgi:hypothetical protein
VVLGGNNAWVDTLNLKHGEMLGWKTGRVSVAFALFLNNAWCKLCSSSITFENISINGGLNRSDLKDALNLNATSNARI